MKDTEPWRGCRPGFLCSPSVTPANIFKRCQFSVQTGGCSLLFILALSLLKGEGNIQLQNIACFYINQILSAWTKGNGCFSVWLIIRLVASSPLNVGLFGLLKLPQSSTTVQKTNPSFIEVCVKRSAVFCNLSILFIPIRIDKYIHLLYLHEFV